MEYIFRGATNFNGNISSWDVSNVTNMQWMFRSAQYLMGIFLIGMFQSLRICLAYSIEHLF